MLIDTLHEAAQPGVRHRLWILSDLQQHDPAAARRCMTIAVDDFVSLDLPVEAVCYLGDATEGGVLSHIHEMAEMQHQQLGRIAAPKMYTVGNHDFDYFARHRDELSRMTIPFVDYMRRYSDWTLPGDYDDPFYSVDMGPYVLCFLTDHAAHDGSWYTTHGVVHGDEAAYPYTAKDYAARMRQVAALNKPVITLSHYAFAGGNRASALFDRYLPLPQNVRLHLYGHAHIGDKVWAGKDWGRKISTVDNQTIVQVDAASLEDTRGSAIRSLVLEWYDTDEIGLWFRNHTRQAWDHVLMLRNEAAD